MSKQRPVYLYLTPFFPSPTSWRGGYCLDAVKAIAKDGRYDVRVIVPGRGDDYEWDGVHVYRMRRYIAPCGLFPFILAPLNDYLFRHLLKRIGVVPADVAVCHANTLDFGHYASHFKNLNRKTTTLIQLHSSYSLDLRSGRLGTIPFHATLLYLFYRHIVEHVDILAFVSKMSKNTFGKQFIGIPEGRIRDVRDVLLLGRFMREMRLHRQVVVYNGVDHELFNAANRTPHKGFVIGCVANFQPLKSQMTLIKAAEILKSSLPDLKVRLVGSGATLPECKRYVSDHALDDTVFFETEIDHRALPDFYRSLDLFVLPSRLEGFVCVCIESLACGTPTMFCETISLSELLPASEKALWCFRPLDADDLANKVRSYYRNRSKQTLEKSLEINAIWKDFLDGIR